MATFLDMNIEKLTGQKTKGRDPSSEYYRGYFENGYGVSVIRGPNSFGYHDGLFELAVLKKRNGEKSHQLCYDTPITHDVIGDLTEEEACDIAILVRELPSHVN